MEQKNRLMGIRRKGIPRRILALFLVLATAIACSAPMGAYADEPPEPVVPLGSTLIYIHDGGDGFSDPDPYPFPAVEGELVASYFFSWTPSKPGYDFVKWQYLNEVTWTWEDSPADIKVPDLPSFLEARALWTPKPASLDFDLNGAQGSLSAIGCSYDGPIPISPSPSRANHAFKGWATTAAASVADFADSAGNPLHPTVDWWDTKTVYAVWEGDPVGVRFFNNYLLSDSTQYDVGNAANAGKRFGDTASSAFAPPRRVGFSFQGWFTAPIGSSLYDFSTPISVTNLDLYAQWVEKLYTVLYDVNGASSAVPPKTDVRWLQSDLVPEKLTRQGYRFCGWRVSSGGYGSNVQKTATYADLAEDDTVSAITLQAQWAGDLVKFDDGSAPSDGSASGGGTAPAAAAPASTSVNTSSDAQPSAVPEPQSELKPEADANKDADIVPIPTPHAVPDLTTQTAPEQPAPTEIWALLNLILTVATAAVMALLIAITVRNRRRAAEIRDERKGGMPLVFASIAVTAAAAILLAFTQNLALAMGMFDGWTVWHAVFLVIQAVIAVAAKRGQAEGRTEVFE
jgi:hypothetical protein